jgi:hypothetical protein
MRRGQTRPEEPIVVLAYPYSGALRVRAHLQHRPELLWVDADFAHSYDKLAVHWRQVEEGRQALSALALASIRSLFQTMVVSRLAATDATFWCFPASVGNSTERGFAELYPGARFLCLHRAPADVMYAALASNPWGLAGTPVAPFTAGYPGNSLAAAAEYWTHHSEHIIEFETVYPGRILRLYYEDLCLAPFQELKRINNFLDLCDASENTMPPSPESQRSPADNIRGGNPSPGSVGCGAEIPFARIPARTRERMNAIMAHLGYEQPTGPGC